MARMNLAGVGLINDHLLMFPVAWAIIENTFSNSAFSQTSTARRPADHRHLLIVSIMPAIRSDAHAPKIPGAHISFADAGDSQSKPDSVLIRLFRR